MATWAPLLSKLTGRNVKPPVASTVHILLGVDMDSDLNVSRHNYNDMYLGKDKDSDRHSGMKGKRQKVMMKSIA